jgi:hypothetical protein
MAVKFCDAVMYILQHTYCCSLAVAGAKFYYIYMYYFSCALTHLVLEISRISTFFLGDEVQADEIENCFISFDALSP